MIDFVWVQKRPGTIHPLSEPNYLIWYGCTEMGIETRLFEKFDEVEGLLTKQTPLSGGVGNVIRALEHLGCPKPPVLDVPESILDYFGRKIWRSTLGWARSAYETGPFFIKPVVQKIFNGHVIGPEFKTLIKSSGHADETEIWVSEAVRFESEYRIMVHHGEMVASRHYAGDFRISPDYSVASAAVRAFEDAPVAYSLDVGVLDTGGTVVVEVNDSFSLGSYGTPPLMYTGMFLDRWEEMVR